MRPVNVWRGVFALLLIVVTTLTVIPNPDDSGQGFALTRWVSSLLFGDAAFSDKIGHFCAYGALGLAAYLAQASVFGRAWAAPLLLAFYGAALEGVQALIATRSAEFADGLANASGAAAGFIGGMVLVRLLARRFA